MNYLNNISFANPIVFWLLLAIPLLIVWYVLKHKKIHPTLQVPGLFQHDKVRNTKAKWRHLPFSLRLLALSAMIVAVARPQSSLSWENVTTEGIDIMIALDISSSMLAADLKPDRLEASKKVALDFIEGRPNDRIGLVIYSGKSFTQCPLTIDHDVLKNLFTDIKNGIIEDGTAIGDGLATSVSRLKDSKAKSKVVILLTDGENTAGSVPPITAAEIARKFGVRVYTVGIGTNGTAPYPVNTIMGRQYQPMPVKIDEATLKSIAEQTGGKYFRATDNKKLEAIYAEIDQLERSKIEVTSYKKKSEEFFPWALAALLLLLIEFTTKNTLFKSVT
jgi:Ca-activated chloride channel family protein